MKKAFVQGLDKLQTALLARQKRKQRASENGSLTNILIESSIRAPICNSCKSLGSERNTHVGKTGVFRN